MGSSSQGGSYITVSVHGDGTATVYGAFVTGSSPQVVPANDTETFVMYVGTQVTIVEAPAGNYTFQRFSGDLGNTTNESVFFVLPLTPWAGQEDVNFTAMHMPVNVNGSTVIHMIIYITLGVGGFIASIIGFVVSADFMVGNEEEREKAWSKLIAWLIGSLLFFGTMLIGPYILGFGI
jgi:hypothetical protein